MAKVACTRCQQEYPSAGLPYRCPVCGGMFDFVEPPAYDPLQVDDTQPGIWPYRHAFYSAASLPTVTLGEGNTPLVEDDAFGSHIACKLEYLNPTGSYKDRGSAVLSSLLLQRRVTDAVEDSSGNAGASFAAYAARAGIHAQVFVPESASGPKRQQIEAFGARLAPIAGPRSAAAEAVLRAAEDGRAYASHAYLPFGMAGIATIAYELFRGLGGVPGAVIAPAGHASLLLGILRGFASLRRAGLATDSPVFVGVQARACAPLAEKYAHPEAVDGSVAEGHTLAEGVRVSRPARKDALLSELTRGKDYVLAIDEEEILPARDELARRGFYVEPTSALVWPALRQLAGKIPEPVVLILTGSGYKYRD